MPILRRDETPDHLATTVLYLWSKKWWIIIPALIFATITYQMRRLTPEVFKVTSEISVSRLQLEEFDPLSPLTVARLLKSAEILHRVRAEYMEKFPDKPAFDQFTGWFSTQTEVVQDTSVKREMSPVIVLQVQAGGGKETMFLMESWLRNFTSQFGSYSAAEAAIKHQALLREEVTLEAELRVAEARQAQYHTELATAGKLLAEHIDLLAPAEWDRPAAAVPARVSGYASNVQMTLNESNRNIKSQGLYSRLADSHIRASTAGSTTAPLHADAEISAITALIADTHTSISELQARVTDLQTSLSAATREVQVKTEEQRALHEAMDTYRVGSAGADVRVLSRPVEQEAHGPQIRPWTKRATAAGIVALLTAGIVTAVLLLYHYLRTIAERAAGTDVV